MSLVFLEQVPTYVYPNVKFHATVKLVGNHKSIGTSIEPQPLQVLLRFHDTYDLVDDQDAELRLASTGLVDATTGLAELVMSVHPVAATCDGRTFCVEVRSRDAALDAVYSSAIHVVKEKLHVVAQPPDVWFKDEGGREKCMAVALALVPAPGASLEDRVVPLTVTLLYESGATVLNQSILRLFPDMRPNMTHGRATISFRIDDVSKNHQGQSFLLAIEPEHQDGSSMFQDIAPTRTSVMAIRSKRNKRKLQTPVGATATYTMRPSPRSVAGTSRGLHHSPHSMNGTGLVLEPPQRARNVLATRTAGGYNGTHGHPAMTSMSWTTPPLMQPPVPSASPVPSHPSGSGVAADPPGVVEWTLSGFELHPDGTLNPARPIYRCPHCRRLNDVDMLAAGPVLAHSPQCYFAATTRTDPLMYRSHMEDPPMNHQRGYTTEYPSLPPNLDLTVPSPHHCYSNGMVDPSSLHVQESTIDLSAKPDVGSPKPLAPFVDSSTPKGTNEAHGSGTGDFEPSDASGNLFESNAFHDQMELMGKSTEKLIMTKSMCVEDDPALDPQSDQVAAYTQDASFSLGGVVRTSLFNEMTSMGINLDQCDPHLLTGLGLDDGALKGTGEDQVFYILARMYTNAHDQKLGLPAFDQFHRMLGFYSEAQDNVQTQVVFHPLLEISLSDEERDTITSRFEDELGRDSHAVHSLPKYQHNLIMLREDALMFYWSQSLV